MCAAHDGGAGAAFCKDTRRPLSRPLARTTAPPCGGARAVMPLAPLDVHS